MKHDFPGYDAPEYGHTHGYGPIQSKPINTGWNPPPTGPCDCVIPETTPPNQCTPVPPPIPPVQYVPGMDVQDQLTNMANRVNVCINRWNDIQRNCYQALDQVVGAAVNNDVYYAPDEVRYTEGYDSDSGCAYGLVEAKAVDRAGNPIFCHLRPAYNNQTNSGAREKITDVSFVTSSQMVMTAVQATETHWKGTTVFNCNPGYSNPDDTAWVAGWNRNGVLRFFQGDVGEDVLRQNRMVNCIGPVFPCVSDGQIYEAVVGAMGTEPGSIQGMGWKANGNKVFFSCGVYDDKGMSPMQAAKILMNIGCKTAVITSYQTKAVTQWDASPIAGTESTMTYATDTENTVDGVPGMTGGMVYLGQLANAPIQWSIPANCATWFISKRPPRGWRNSFTTEVANVVQRLGNQQNYMNSILGQLNGENEAISKLQYDVTQNTNDVAALQGTIGGFDTRIKDVESQVADAETKVTTLTTQVENLETSLNAEIETRKTQVNSLQSANENETAERKAADAALQAAITQEIAARKSADVVLQNNIDAEEALRDAEDKNLASKISTEVKDRTVADLQLAQEIKTEAEARETAISDVKSDIGDIKQSIDDIQDGKSLPIASKTSLGIVKIGSNLNIDEDGTLSGMSSSGGDVIDEGEGIIITESGDGTKTISVDTNIIATEDSVAEQVKAISGAQEETANKVADLETKQAEDSANISELTDKIEEVQNGSGLPIASTTTLGAVKIGANLSISEDGVLSAPAGGGEGVDTHSATAGEGISVEYAEETHVYTISLDKQTRDTLAEIPNIKTQGETNAEDIAVLQTGQTDATSEITAIKEKDDEQDAAIAKNAKDIGDTNTVLSSVNANAVNASAKADAAQTTADTANATAEKVEAEIVNKVDKAGDTMTGDLNLNGAKLVLQNAEGTVVGALAVVDGVLTLVGPENGNVVLRGLAAPINGADAVPKNYVDTAINSVSEAAQQAATDAATANALATEAKTAADEAKESAESIDVSNFVEKTGDTMSGALCVSGENKQLTYLGKNSIYLSEPNGVVDIIITNVNAKPAIKLEGISKGIYIGYKDGNIILSNANWFNMEDIILHGVLTPISDNDAANKAYVDSMIGSASLTVKEVILNSGDNRTQMTLKYAPFTIGNKKYAAIIGIRITLLTNLSISGGSIQNFAFNLQNEESMLQQSFVCSLHEKNPSSYEETVTLIKAYKNTNEANMYVSFLPQTSVSWSNLKQFIYGVG